MFDCFETLKTGRSEGVTFASLLLVFALAGSGFVGVLAASSSEAEVEFFGEQEVEESLIVVLNQRAGRRAATRPKRRGHNPAGISWTHHSDAFLTRTMTGHRYTNGLLAPIRC
jgi:hypothetical protein